jgi:hypothetical protein
MSRTFKDAPRAVKAHRKNGCVPSDWRSRESYWTRKPGGRFENGRHVNIPGIYNEDYDPIEDIWDQRQVEIHAIFLRTLKACEPRLRAAVRDAIAHEDYDAMPHYRRAYRRGADWECY